MEIGVGIQGACGLIPEKLGLDCKPDVAGGGTVLGDGVGEVVGDGAEEPGPHDTILAGPIGGGGNGGVREDMALQGIPPSEVEGLTPSSVEGGRHVEEAEWDEQADVLHRSRLRVEVDERGGLMLSSGVEDGLVVDGGKGGFVVVMGRRRRKIGRGAFLRGSVASRSASAAAASRSASAARVTAASRAAWREAASAGVTGRASG
jgi:hypothetical protein